MIVMMDKPSPIQVGQEFVRQYYTLLNKAPEHLHRFYSMNSSYVHGGKYCNGEPEQPVIGQNEIHQKIKSLKFSDCHTKIRQVDSHSTIGNGIVVQVTGELSNCGQPLRRFMQTFVLAPKGDNPFKFYVHNDIFRYQDEVFNDDVTTETPEEDEQVDNRVLSSETLEPGYSEDYYNTSSSAAMKPEQPLTNGIEQQPESSFLDKQDSAASTTFEETIQPPTPCRTPSPVRESQEIEQSSDEVGVPCEEPLKDAQSLPDEFDAPEVKTAPKPVSWADLASKNTPAERNNVQHTTIIQKSSPDQHPESNETSGTQARPSRGQASHARDEDRFAGGDRFDPPRKVNGPGTGQSAGRDSGNIRYPDNQQIFVGNLPYEISEADLWDHFADFGPVLEVRINRSYNNNPNFGFVIFENPKSVEDVLEVLPNQIKNNYRINIEVKRQRNRDNNRRPGDSRRSGLGDSRGGRRRAPPMKRDRQGSREAVRPNYANGPRR